LMSAVALWFYQTMDNLDGRQARRTKSSSPLGQLFDHGTASLSPSRCAFYIRNTLIQTESERRWFQKKREITRENRTTVKKQSLPFHPFASILTFVFLFSS
jgi:hypothetical protein